MLKGLNIIIVIKREGDVNNVFITHKYFSDLVELKTDYLDLIMG